MDVATGTARQVFAIGMWFRVVCAAVFIVFVVFCQALGITFTSGNVGISYLCLGLLVVVNAGYWLVGLNTRFDLRQFYGHWAVDLALISGVLWGLGGAAVVAAIPAYSLIIVTSATFISRAAAFVVASGGAATFVLLVNTGSLVSGIAGGADAGHSSFFLAGNGVLFFYLFAFLAGTLATALSDANLQLRQQNKELADKNRELDGLHQEIDFQTAVLTHDIRSPVAAAASALGMLRSECREVDAAEDLVAIALQNLARADAMIDDLREVRVVNAREFVRTDVDLRELCALVRSEFEVELETGGIRLEIGDTNATIPGDPKALRIAVRNLVGNAVRYVPRDGSGIISVGIAGNESGLEIEVADNGPGIPPEQRTEVFKSFRKLPGDEASRGMGLGLAIVKRVIERHGGSISLGASEFGGAAFRMFLPR